jgi:hypothetical protein
MRQDAWKIMTGSKWGWKILLNGIVLYAIMIAVVVGLDYVFEAAGIQTWESFREAQREAKRSGVDLAIASGHEAMRMTLASGISAFVNYLFQGIVAFGMITTLLKCVKGETQGWFSGAFGGFARPLEMLWLTILMMIKVFLWALLLIIPGIIACLRYALAWYVKAENPDMGANDCIKRSCELMHGRKCHLVVFGLSYICWYLLVFLAVMIMAICMLGIQEEDAVPSLVSILVAGGSVVMTIAIAAFVGIYAAIGQAVFYRDAKAEVETANGSEA